VFCVLCFIWTLAWGDQTDVKDKGLQYQKIVTDMKDLTANFGNPLEVFYTNKADKEMKFDAPRYFTILKKISLPEGKILDYVYVMTGSARYPVLYIRSNNQKPYNEIEEYNKSPDHANISRDKMMDNIVEMLEVMDTEDGYFEYVVFYLMAPDFYLYKWTQLDHEIICHETRLNDKLKNDSQIPAAVKTAAKKLNLFPEINLAPDKAEVKIVTFTAHGGFFEERFIISRSFPHALLEHTKQGLVEYNSRTIF